MADIKKIDALFRLIKYFVEKKEISSYDEEIQEEFNCSQRTLYRYLQELSRSYDHIIEIENSKQATWRLVGISDILEEFLKNSDDIREFYLMAKDYDPQIFTQLEKTTLKKLLNNEDSLFLFKNSIIEELKDEKFKELFEQLKYVIKKRIVIDISYTYDKNKYREALKPIKLVFMNNNWYLATIYEEKVKFVRVAFVDKLSFTSQRFKNEDIKEYLSKLKNIQNAMTLLDEKIQTATIKALPDVAKYFEPGMKKYFPSQKFVKKESDGSIIFTVDYTQPLEILPFIQRWLPDLTIIEPTSLKNELLKKLQIYINNNNS